MKSGRTLEPEDVIAHYRVVGPLGAGGMGEVYLAQDQTLERNVALKVLPPEFTKDDERLRRFVLEAKSASSLSHPNIVTIYEIGTDVVRDKDGVAEPDSAPVQFISMELIHGKTLSTLIHEERTDLRTLLGYLAQAAEGLAKAHSAGIVHRDLKPGNIMVSGDGFAKVLDFGLAKLTESRESNPDMSSAPTVVEDATGAGSLLGTTGYMSPEQIRAKGVDQRSDVFSFGCVLYEAATRARPFTAETAVETMHKILNDTPPPIEERNPKAPAELRRLIRRCLAKNPDQRVQSMKDLAIELREIVDEWDNLTSTATSVGNAAAAAALATKTTRTTRGLLAGAGVVVVAAIAVALWAMRREAPPAPAAQPFQSMRLSTQTNRGDVTEAALSRDGRYLAYLTGEVGKGSVRVRQVATGSDLEVVPAEEGLFEGLSFTPDGNYLFYLKRRRDTPNYRGLMQVPSLGGPSRERAFDVDSRVTFSPDGKSIAFNRGEPQKSRALIVVRDLESGSERVLATVADPRQLSSPPSWSADGKRIAAAETDTSAGTFVAHLVVFDAADGRREELEVLKGGITESVAWLPDGSGVIRAGYELGTSISRQIAIVDYPSGRARRVTNDASDYIAVSVSAGDEAIAAVKRARLGDLWVADAVGGEPKPLTSYRNPENSPFGSSACPDGGVVFAASRDQSVQLWSIGPAGGAPVAISGADALAINPHCVPGGVVYDQFDDKGGVHVWRMESDGSNPRMLTPDFPSQTADVSRNGKYASVVRLDDKSLWLAPVDGRAGATLAPRGGIAKFSRDGTKVLNSDLDTGSGGLVQRVLRIYPVAGGTPTPGPKLPPQGELIEWGPDGGALYFVDRSQPVWNLFRMPLSGGTAAQVTSFPEGKITAYEFSPDGTKLAVALAIGRAGNIWVMAADGSKPVQITKFPQDEIFQLHWMADGKHIVINAGKTTTDAVMIRNFR